MSILTKLKWMTLVKEMAAHNTGFYKSGVFELNLNIGILIKVCTKLNICTLTSPLPRKPLNRYFLQIRCRKINSEILP